MHLGDVRPADRWWGVSYTQSRYSFILHVSVDTMTHSQQTHAPNWLQFIKANWSWFCCGKVFLCCFYSLSTSTYFPFQNSLMCGGFKKKQKKNNHLYVCEVSSCQPGWTVRQAVGQRLWWQQCVWIPGSLGAALVWMVGIRDIHTKGQSERIREQSCLKRLLCLIQTSRVLLCTPLPLSLTGISERSDDVSEQTDSQPRLVWGAQTVASNWEQTFKKCRSVSV